MAWSGSYEELVAYLGQFTNIGGDPAYDTNGILRLLLTLADNLQQNATEEELSELREVLDSQQAEFLCWLGSAPGDVPTPAPPSGVAAMNPEKLPSRLQYIRGIIRNRLQEKGHYYNHEAALQLLGEAYLAGVSVEELEDIAKSLSVKTWTHFRDAVHAAINRGG